MSCANGQLAQFLCIEAFRLHGTGHYINQFRTFTYLGDDGATQQGLQSTRNFLGVQAQCSSAILIDHKAQRLGAFVPLQVHVTHIRVSAHAVPHPCGDCAHSIRISPAHAELHRVAHGRPQLKPVNSGADMRESSRQTVAQVGCQRTGLFQLVRIDDQLRVVELWRFRI